MRGAVLKGPTDLFMEWAGHPLSADGICAHYAGLIDGLVSDERASDVPTLETDVEMGDADGPAPRGARDAELRRRPARVAFAASLRTLAVLPVKSFGRAKQRLGEAVGADERRALARAMAGDVLEALGRVDGLDGVIVVPRSALGDAVEPGGRVEVVPRSRGGRASPRRPCAASVRRSSGARSGCCSCRATARRSSPAEVDASC